MRRNVDLPQPDGPMSAVTRPAGIRSETRSRTLWPPNHAEMLRASSSAVVGVSAVYGSSVVLVTAGPSQSVWSQDVRQQPDGDVGRGGAEHGEDGDADDPRLH